MKSGVFVFVFSFRSNKNLVENSKKPLDSRQSVKSGFVESESTRSGMGARSNSSWKSESQASYPPVNKNKFAVIKVKNEVTNFITNTLSVSG